MQVWFLNSFENIFIHVEREIQVWFISAELEYDKTFGSHSHKRLAEQLKIFPFAVVDFTIKTDLLLFVIQMLMHWSQEHQGLQWMLNAMMLTETMLLLPGNHQIQPLRTQSLDILLTSM